MSSSQYLKASIDSLQHAIVTKKEDISKAQLKIDEIEKQKQQYIQIKNQSQADIETLDQQIKAIQTELQISQENEKLL